MQPDSLGIFGGFRENIMVEFCAGGADALAVVAVSVSDERSGDETQGNLTSFDGVAFFEQARVFVTVAGREAIGEESDVSTGEVEAGKESASDGGRGVPSPDEEREGGQGGDGTPGFGFERHFQVRPFKECGVRRKFAGPR